ncbi:U-box domain-containing protein [Thalictrum thalictroides]|uniref:RING-type E3 ubiquitin transferase n=1 Tax=Thalictrum thalictroides TaxID=46969 RepID=A0A7J6WIW4_THATH|nr:U-box domain-containing protein [Thalictrum thalictroides]
MGSSKTKRRWKIIFSRSPPSSNLKLKPPPHSDPPNEFICPISQSLMADPVIISSGQTFERNCIQVCQNLNFTPILSNGLTPNFSTLIPNIAIKSTILNWCDNNSVIRPKPISLNVAEKLVRSLMLSQGHKTESKESSNSLNESQRRTSHFRFSSEESVSSSLSEIVIIEETSNSEEEEKFLVKLKSSEVSQQEEALILLRQITRKDPTIRIPLCTLRLLSALRSFIISKSSVLQVNSIAVLVNLSLEMVNKVKIVRSGSVPQLIEILKCGSPESVEYSVSLLFSLSLDDQNKTAIGVLGGLPPLLNLVKSEIQRVSHESLLALYHLSFVQSNRSKLVKLGAVRVLFGLINTDTCSLRILCNLAMCAEGRAALLDVNAVKWLVDMIKCSSELESVVSREKCVETLYGLSCGSLRFKGMAKEAGAVEVLSEVVERGSDRVKEKAKRMLSMIKEGDEKEKDMFEEVDWESLLMDSGEVSRSCFRRLDSA